jgi:anti-anti-sigma factor
LFNGYFEMTMAQFENDDEVFFNVMPGMACAGAEDPVFDVGSMDDFSQAAPEKKSVLSSESQTPVPSTVAESPSRMVQLAKANRSVSGSAEKTAPEAIAVKAGNTGPTDIPKKEIMDRDSRPRLSQALGSVKPAPQPQPVPNAPAADSLDFRASVVEGPRGSECRIIALKGMIDLGQRAALETFFDANLPQTGARVILDMDGVVSMSSSGWGVMVAHLQRLKKFGGSVSLCCLHGEVEQCFRVLDLHVLFTVFHSRAEALQNTDQKTKTGDFSGPEKTIALVTSPDTLGNPASFPLEEKIRRIIAENPYLGAGRIAKLLRTEAYGKTRINAWTLRARLKSMNLSTKEERYRFFRSS